VPDPSQSLINAVEAAVVILCLCGIALISAAEAALVSVNKVRLRQLCDEGNRAARRAARLADNREEVLRALIIGLNLFIILASALVTDLSHKWWGAASVPYAAAGTIVIILVLCEITPKTHGVIRAEATTLRLARPIASWTRLMSPMGRGLGAVARVIINGVWVPIMGGQAVARETGFSEEEIKQLVIAGEEGGEVAREEREMIHRAIEFPDKIAREVMVPRLDMVCLEDTASLAEALAAAQEHGHSRIPVYHESIDNITGVVYAKDLLIRLYRGDHRPLVEVAREAYFVPESKKVDELLREMQIRHRHLAIVIDEYGATAGLVTIEDLIEEIVGPIMDEYDKVEEPSLQMIGEDVAEGDARASVDELSHLFDVTLPEGDFDSVGGLIVDRLGRLPEEGDRVECNGLALTVLEVAQHRVERVRIERLPESAQEPEPENKNNDRRK